MDIDIELSALRAVLIEVQRDLAEVRAESKRADDFATGITAALLPILPLLLKEHPKIAELAMRSWGRSRWTLEHLQRGGTSEHSPEYYEPASVWFGVCKLAGVPVPEGAGGPPNLRVIHPRREDD